MESSFRRIAERATDSIFLSVSDNGIESKCQDVHDEVVEITREHIINKKLAEKLNARDSEQAFNQYTQRYDTWHKQFSSFEMLVAHYGPFFLLIMGAAFWAQNTIAEKESSYYPLAIFLVFIMFSYQQLFKTVPFSSMGRFFLSQNKKKLAVLKENYDKTIQQAKNAVCLYHEPGFRGSGVDDALLRGLFGIKNKAFDCIAIAAIVVLKLYKSKPLVRIEWVANKPGETITGHSYVIVNRRGTEKNLNDFSTWNDDCWIVCPWYEICKSVKTIKEEEKKGKTNFFNQYLLLDPRDKEMLLTIPEKIPKHLEKAIDKYQELLNDLLSSRRSCPCPELPYVSILCPKL